MGHKIKALVLNNKVIASDAGSSIKRVIFNGAVIWPYSDSPNLIISEYDGIVSTYEDVKAGYVGEVALLATVSKDYYVLDKTSRNPITVGLSVKVTIGSEIYEVSIDDNHFIIDGDIGKPVEIQVSALGYYSRTVQSSLGEDYEVIELTQVPSEAEEVTEHFYILDRDSSTPILNKVKVEVLSESSLMELPIEGNHFSITEKEGTPLEIHISALGYKDKIYNLSVQSNTEDIYMVKQIAEPITNIKIKKIVFNKEQIWPSDTFLSVEKENITLSELNNWEDTNTIYTNSLFIIS